MSKWIRGIYNAAANFNLSGSLRAAAGRTLGGNRKLVREELNKRNESSKPNKSDNECGSDTDCLGCAPFSCARHDPNSNHYIGSSSVIIGNDVIITDSNDICDTQCNKCHPTLCDHIERDYADYTASIRTKGQGASSWIRVSDEPRDFKHTSDATRNDIEHITGIQPGVTV